MVVLAPPRAPCGNEAGGQTVRTVFDFWSAAASARPWRQAYPWWALKLLRIHSLHHPRLWVWLTLGLVRPLMNTLRLLSLACKLVEDSWLAAEGFQIDSNWGQFGALISVVAGPKKHLIYEALKVLENRYLFGSPGTFFYSVLNK